MTESRICFSPTSSSFQHFMDANLVKCFAKLLLSLLVINVYHSKALAVSYKEYFANEWAVEILGGGEVADQIASTHGFINHGLILQGENYYRFSHPTLRKRSTETSQDHHAKLISHEKVMWVEQQRIKRRIKRDLRYDPNEEPNDPKWSQMWYLQTSAKPSMRVVDAWKAGYTGKNVAVTILDDGIEHSHPDLKENYDPLASGDINDHDDDPTPRLNPSNENRHGTRCAGEVAAVANNSVCSIGIAYNAKIGGVRMLDGQVTDAVEAASIGLNPQHVDIYSSSWGPDDDGRTVDGPAKLAKTAFINGVTKGRNGKGSIYVWASGNGGRYQDNCNCDGYTDSIYTLSISSATQQGHKPWYSESCSSTLAATYSSGSTGEGQIVTTDLRHRCTTTHTGTSAAAPLAAAICALALEANPDLTWRDMQHLVVQTARPDELSTNDWVVNGVNRKVSHAFGYGLMDAYSMVIRAKNWTLVPPQRKCIKGVISAGQTPRELSSTIPLVVPVDVFTCDNDEDAIERLEHVQAELTLRNEHRGNLIIRLTSPMGTTSELLGHRRLDVTKSGFTKWAFMTTHSWDEDPRGRWKLEINDESPASAYGLYETWHRPPIEAKAAFESTLSMFNLVLYGTKHGDWSESSNLVAAHFPANSTETTSKSSKVTNATMPRMMESNQTTASSVSSVLDPITSLKTKGIVLPLEKSSLGGCKISLSSGTGCLICERNSILDPSKNVCVKSCDVGHYVAHETVNELGVRKTSSQSHSILQGQEGDIRSGYVCRRCTTHCHNCVGPSAGDCVQCVSGTIMEQQSYKCVLSSKNISSDKSGNNIAYFLVALGIIIVCAVLMVAFLTLCQRRRSLDASTTSYKYLPNGDGIIEELCPEEYHDEDAFTDDPTLDSSILPDNYPNGYASIPAS